MLFIMHTMYTHSLPPSCHLYDLCLLVFKELWWESVGEPQAGTACVYVYINQERKSNSTDGLQLKILTHTQFCLKAAQMRAITWASYLQQSPGAQSGSGGSAPVAPELCRDGSEASSLTTLPVHLPVLLMFSLLLLSFLF